MIVGLGLWFLIALLLNTMQVATLIRFQNSLARTLRGRPSWFELSSRLRDQQADPEIEALRLRARRWNRYALPISLLAGIPAVAVGVVIQALLGRSFDRILAGLSSFGVLTTIAVLGLLATAAQSARRGRRALAVGLAILALLGTLLGYARS